ncbi:hypothetical protein ACLGIH_01090 [Streptomyces sp. HMX87]|uniref:hypothetical protein n=1 Tax=Streptomyces sp. HMX87 TaxID=3390849 RepID=UPI003A879205
MPEPPPSPTPTADAATTVERYFAAINAGDYRRAWDLGGKNLDRSYASFAAGFADTVHDAVQITEVRGSVVTVTLDALQSDGTVRSFAGTYTVKGGVIVDADIRRVDSPAPEPGRPYPPGPPAGVPDIDCSDLSGPVDVSGGDPHNLDADDDGIGCESN